jgi:hypothetical protein
LLRQANAEAACSRFLEISNGLYTLSAPKSVSIAALVQQDDQVLAAHRQAVTTALTILEQHYAQTQQMTAMERVRVLTDFLICQVIAPTYQKVQPSRSDQGWPAVFLQSKEPKSSCDDVY